MPGKADSVASALHPDLPPSLAPKPPAAAPAPEHPGEDPHTLVSPDRSPRAVQAIFWIAVVFSLYQVYTAAYAPLSSLVMRSLHVGFLLLLTFACLPTWSRGTARNHWIGWTLGIIGFGVGLYQWGFEEELIVRSGDLTTMDLYVGIALLALVFEAARRMMGPALPLICGTFLAYALFGEYLPGALAHRGYGLDQVVNQMSYGTEGIFGIPTYVSSTYIFLFILFGTFLEQAGMIQLFTDFALGTVGHTRGGPAKVAVIASGLMGTINGSGVANVVTTGQFTIPLMKRFGGGRAHGSHGHAEGPMPRPLGRGAAGLVPGAATGCPGLAAVLWLHPVVLGHGGSGRHGDPDLRRCRYLASARHRAADHLLGRARARVLIVPALGHQRGVHRDRGAGRD